MNVRYSLLLLLVLVGTTVVACNRQQRPEGFPDLYPCSIKIIQDGQPLAGASVSLVAQDPALMRWPCGGNTAEDGIVKLATYGYEGAPAGTFKVIVSKTESVGGVQNAEDAKRQMQGEDLGQTETFNLIDPIYRDQTSSPLSIEIKASENPVAEYDVGEAVHTPIKMPGS